MASCAAVGQELFGLLGVFAALLSAAAALRFYDRGAESLVSFFQVPRSAGFVGGATTSSTPESEAAAAAAAGSAAAPRDHFWEGYSIQLPLLCIMGDVMSFRRDISVVISGVVSTLCISVLSGALGRCNLLHRSITRESSQLGPSGGPLVQPTPPVRGMVQSIVFSVNQRSRSMLFSAGAAIWSIMLGKAAMRYTVDAWGFSRERNDERAVVEAALLVYTLLPMLDPPFSFSLSSSASTSRMMMMGGAGKLAVEKVIHLILFITFLPLMF